MSTTRTHRPAHLSRRALVVPAILVALGIFLLYGTLTMETVGDGGLFGPTTMPWIVVVLCFVVAAGLAFDILRPRPEYAGAAPVGTNAASTGTDATVTSGVDGPADDDGDARPSPADDEGVNATAVLTAVAGVAAFILVLPWLGWILSATGLFTAIAAALGNRKWIPVVLAGLALASAIQVVFSGMLGISLPAGFVGGI